MALAVAFGLLLLAVVGAACCLRRRKKASGHVMPTSFHESGKYFGTYNLDISWGVYPLLMEIT